MSPTQRLFMIGLVVAMLGVQLRLVDHFVLNEKVTRVLDRHLPASQVDDAPTDLVAYSTDVLDVAGGSRRSIHPPDWLGWSLISVGLVLVLTSPIFRT